MLLTLPVCDSAIFFNHVSLIKHHSPIFFFFLDWL
jgi:hypothetical protein